MNFSTTKRKMTTKDDSGYKTDFYSRVIYTDVIKIDFKIM
jgi:hypothetical protein